MKIQQIHIHIRKIFNAQIYPWSFTNIRIRIRVSMDILDYSSFYYYILFTNIYKDLQVFFFSAFSLLYNLYYIMDQFIRPHWQDTY
jgi:hypothetical protein